MSPVGAISAKQVLSEALVKRSGETNWDIGFKARVNALTKFAQKHALRSKSYCSEGFGSRCVSPGKTDAKALAQL